jgi:hypothetical protein
MKKGQTALEYLITYGWAILIILVVLAVLWYYDVFNPGKWAGETRYCPADFEMLGATLSGAGSVNGTLTLVLGNKVGNQITLNTITVAGDLTGTVSPGSTLGPGGQTSAIAITVADMTGYSAGDLVQMTATVAFTDNQLSLNDTEPCDVRIKAS